MNEDVNKAVRMCANGMGAREAWRACGKPVGERAIQNIAKRGKALREAEAVCAGSDACSPLLQPNGELVGADDRHSSGGSSAPRKQRSREEKGFRLKPDQAAMEMKMHADMRKEFDVVFAEATQEWADMVSSGKRGKGDKSADAVAARWKAKLPAGCKYVLTGNSLKHAYRNGTCGKPLKKTGLKGGITVIPSLLVKGVAEHVQMEQIGGNELKPRQIIETAIALVQGTSHEGCLAEPHRRRHLLSRVRREFGLAAATSTVIDDRRWQWLTSGNLTRWFEGYAQTLSQFEFIPGLPDNPFEVIVIDEQKCAYMLNADKSHQKLSNEGEDRGPRSHVYINPALGRPGKRKIEYQKHATIMICVNYAGEVCAPHLMLASDAEAAKKNAPNDANQDGIRIRPEWTFGVPRVYGKFGHQEEVLMEPSFVLNEKGGMIGGGLEMFVEKQIYPAYPQLQPEWQYSCDRVTGGPVFLQLDAGPDRYTECSLQFRADAWTRGLVLFPGLPNGTAANQVCDDLFGPYKTACAQNIEDLVASRIVAQRFGLRDESSTKVGIDFSDLGYVVNGHHADPLEKRPFMRAFTKEKILASTAKLGLSPIDLRKALSHKRVRDDSKDGCRSQAIDAIKQSHTSTLEQLKSAGFNAGTIQPSEKALQLQCDDAESGVHVAGLSSLEERWAAVKAAGGCAGAHFVSVGAKAFNCQEVLGPALERVEERVQAAADKKVNAELEYRSLHKAVSELVDNKLCLGDEGDDNQYMYGDLSMQEIRNIVIFVHKAKGLGAYSKHCSSKAVAIEFLEGMEEDVAKILEDFPPKEPVTALSDGETLLTLTGPTAAVQAARFKGIDVELSGMVAMSPPAGLEGMLIPTANESQGMIGKSILYKWPVRLGGWMVGKILSTNKDPKNTVTDKM